MNKFALEINVIYSITLLLLLLWKLYEICAECGKLPKDIFVA